MGFVDEHLLSLIIFLPLLGMGIILAIPGRWSGAIRLLSLFISLAVFAMAAAAFMRIKGTGDFEMVEVARWIPVLKINYHIGIDGVSALLILMTAFLVFISVLASWKEVAKSVKAFHALILLLETGMLGVFAALDLFLFYVFWEAVLIPMIFIIGIWGSKNRIAAAIKFVIFTTAGSVLMLAAIIYMASASGSFSLLASYAHRFTAAEQLWLFAGFSIAFAIKVPLIGLHTWLPDAHTEAPTAGSVLLAGVLLKMGTYGFFRFAMPLFPSALAASMDILLVFAVAGIVGGALIAMVQPDLKRLIAYSSVSHMGFVILGLCALEKHAVAGAVMQMVNHGLTTGALFLIVGMLYSRRGTMMIADYGGSARAMPVLTFFFILMTFSSIGLPGLNNFPGEFLILLGSFQTRTVYASIAIIGVVLVAVYMLWVIHRVFFGPLRNEEERKLPDLRFREYALLLPIAVLTVIIGVWPQALLGKISRSSDVFISLSRRVDLPPAQSSPPKASMDVKDQGGTK